MKSFGQGSFSGSRKRDFRRRLLAWYDEYRRDLPWRQSHDPYCIWLSEIMLQQTRVAAVIDHYHEFLRRFPTVEKLAKAREGSVLAAWSGLGYYRRARMLHAAAKVIVHERGGKFPSTARELRGLPGVGRYTAAAIASISYRESVAVVDGNVERVLQRLGGERLAGETCWKAAGNLLDREHPGDFNQAMMELGATVCTPKAPACLTCPVVEFCATRGELRSDTKVVPKKKREIHYVLARRNGSVLLVQRPRDASLMPGMWELPEVAPPSGAKAHAIGTSTITLAGATQERPADKDLVAQARAYLTLRHSITVTNYTVRVWNCGFDCTCGRWVDLGRLTALPLTGLTRKILRAAGVI